ncbi:MAG: hypothetical protein M9928_01430 [Anaerolineae bacterium]|nr:hypothetical protein [Anaerolineae bacterium]MCO5186895.1 hypothetical protein [Anaerolineae bacterium]MCO5192620.1 hypothetical protein [Anaerolineae bacterium]MCO5199156.1 hypothetical protein [Anaerolineae bacterium]MCO5203672.1 hypothetical protein [Anaerolineae bacterium]
MKIIRNETRIRRLKTAGNVLAAVGMIILLGGLVMAFVIRDPNLIIYQLLALAVGFVLSQISIYLSNRYGRNPRTDILLDQAVGNTPKNRFYHYILPAPHVLLTLAGPVVLVPKFQGGTISAEGETWKQTGVGLRKYLGQEGVGNPTKEADAQVGAIANFLRKNAPELSEEEIPIGVIIVFTRIEPDKLDVRNSSIPAMHHKALRSYLKKHRGAPMPKAQYDSIRAAFDAKAGPLADGEDDD